MKISTIGNMNHDDSSRGVAGSRVHGRVGFAAVALLVVAILSGSCVIGAMRENHVGRVPETQKVISYTVRPGDTLWSCAQQVTPQGESVSQTVDRMMQLNDLDSASLRPGQRLEVPAD